MGRNTISIDGLVLLPLKVVEILPLATPGGEKKIKRYQQTSSFITGINCFSSKFNFHLKIFLPKHPETDSQEIRLIYII